MRENLIVTFGDGNDDARRAVGPLRLVGFSEAPMWYFYFRLGAIMSFDDYRLGYALRANPTYNPRLIDDPFICFDYEWYP